MLQVKKVSIVGAPRVSGFGITDGKKWFWWAYESQESAEKMLSHFDTETAIGVNICWDGPSKLSYLTPANIKSGE